MKPSHRDTGRLESCKSYSVEWRGLTCCLLAGEASRAAGQEGAGGEGGEGEGGGGLETDEAEAAPPQTQGGGGGGSGGEVLSETLDGGLGCGVGGGGRRSGWWGRGYLHVAVRIMFT